MKERRLLLHLLLYSYTVVMISIRWEGLYFPLEMIIFLILAMSVDFVMAKRRIRWYLRFFSVIFIVLSAVCLVRFFSFLSSAEESFNWFDLFPYYFLRDLCFLPLFLSFYFLLDAQRIEKINWISEVVSAFSFLILFYFLFQIDGDIGKSPFRNYMIYSMAMFPGFFLLLFRFILGIYSASGREWQRRDSWFFLSFVVVMLLFLISVPLQNFMKSADNSSGGIFESNLFHFDFSNFLQLKDSLKLSEDRVLILEADDALVHLSYAEQAAGEEEGGRQLYIKRFSLEEYVSPIGFRASDRVTQPDSPPPYLSGYAWERKQTPQLRSSRLMQNNFYLLNIDSASVLGNELLYKITPIEGWKDAPFKQIYRSFSLVYTGDYTELFLEEAGQEKFLASLPPERRELLLYAGSSETEQRVAALTRQIIEGQENLFLKILLIQEFLRNQYYYSLKPGLSGKMPPIEYFLFESKKGYCSYFAFAMTLMLRSVGVASRVAVGFAPDRNNRTMNFFDVRVCDGHAWVEVYFDEYGWILFDPTSSNLLPEEEFQLPRNQKEERDRLIDTILEHKEEMREITEMASSFSVKTRQLVSKMNHSIRMWGGILLGIFCLFFSGCVIWKKMGQLWIYRMTKKTDLRVIALYRWMLTQLAATGEKEYRIRKGETMEEFSSRLEPVVSVKAITQLYQRGLFGGQWEEENGELEEIYLAFRNTFRRIPLKKRWRALFPVSLFFQKILPVFFFFLLPTFFYSEGLEGMIKRAKEAAEQSYFEQALQILGEAQKRYPDSYLPNYQKGQLLYDNELFLSAAREFEKAKEKGLVNEEIYLGLGACYSKEGRDAAALSVYEEAMERVGESVSLVDTLAWSYYKAHYYQKGIEFLTGKLEQYRHSPDILMTLGTLYSSVWDYENSKKFYLEAIEKSYGNKFHDFRSITYYNLSLLEESFLYYEDAYQCAMVALSLADRSSPHLGLAYLHLSSMELPQAYREIRAASSTEPKTLFSQLALCSLYYSGGYVEESIQLAKELLLQQDYQWLAYFGMSISSFRAELYRILALGYRYLANVVSFSERNGWKQRLTRPFRKLRYRFLSFCYQIHFTNLSLEQGRLKIKGGSDLEGLHQMISALERTDPRKAGKLSRICAAIEIPLIPEKKRIYEAQNAYLDRSVFKSGDRKARDLLRAADQLDVKWEKEMILELLFQAVKYADGGMRQEIVEKLFIETPAVFPLNGIKVPAFFYATSETLNAAVKEIGKRGFQYNEQSNIMIALSEDTEEKAGKGKSVVVRISLGGTLLKRLELPFSSLEEFGPAFYRAVFLADLQD